MARVEFQEVTKRFGDEEWPALADCTLSISSGSSVSIIGPSGAGKTTLLRLAAGALLPDEGRIQIDDEPPSPGDAAMISQGDVLAPRRTVLTNVLVGRTGQRSLLGGLIEPYLRRDLSDPIALLRAAGLDEHVQTRVDELSAGERQRAAVVRALLQDSPLILADEPTANLDPGTSERVLSLLNEHVDRTRIVALHDIDVISSRFFDRVIGIRAGTITFDLPPAQVTAQTLDDLYADHPNQVQEGNRA